MKSTAIARIPEQYFFLWLLYIIFSCGRFERVCRSACACLVYGCFAKLNGYTRIQKYQTIPPRFDRISTLLDHRAFKILPVNNWSEVVDQYRESSVYWLVLVTPNIREFGCKRKYKFQENCEYNSSFFVLLSSTSISKSTWLQHLAKSIGFLAVF